MSGAPWSHGGVLYPLPAATTNPLLQDADPALFIALDFFSAALNLHIGARLKAQALLERIKIDHAVLTRMAVKPTPAILAENFHFPLFALYRIGSVDAELTSVFTRDASEWGFAYVLPMLTASQTPRLAPILRSVERTLSRAIEKGSEPDYASGANVWAAAGIDSIRLKDAKYEDFDAINQENGSYRALTGTIVVMERDVPVLTGLPFFAGADVTIDGAVPDGTAVSALVELSTQPAPTLSTIVSSSGSKAGGVSVTVIGTGFQEGAEIRIGGAPATSVVVVNATTATCLTPAHDAYPTYLADVVLTNPDGQSATLPAAYTFI